MKISEKSSELLKFIYDESVSNPTKTNFLVRKEPSIVSSKLQTTENDVIKCLLYLEDKRFIEILNRNKYNHYRITAFGIDFIESL